MLILLTTEASIMSDFIRYYKMNEANYPQRKVIR